MYYTDIHEGKTPIYIKQANIKARCHTALSHMVSKRQEYKDLPKNTAKAEWALIPQSGSRGKQTSEFVVSLIYLHSVSQASQVYREPLSEK